MPPSICHSCAFRIHDDSHVLRTHHPDHLDSLRCRVDLDLGYRRDVGAGIDGACQPDTLSARRGGSLPANALAAACSTLRILGSVRLRSRNASGSTPAAAAIVSICDSIAKVFMFAPGPLHGPTAKG